jgi:hypothetical protein
LHQWSRLTSLTGERPAFCLVAYLPCSPIFASSLPMADTKAAGSLGGLRASNCLKSLKLPPLLRLQPLPPLNLCQHPQQQNPSKRQRRRPRRPKRNPNKIPAAYMEDSGRACNRFKASSRFWRLAPPPRSPWSRWHAQLLDLARKSAGLPPAELQASLMLLASDALSKFDGSTAPASPPPAGPRAAETQPEGDSTGKKEEPGLTFYLRILIGIASKILSTRYRL